MTRWAANRWTQPNQQVRCAHDPASFDIADQPLQRRPLQRAAAVAAIVIAVVERDPAFMALAVDVRGASFALGIQAVEALLQTLFGAFPTLNGDQIHGRKPPREIVLDMDSSESPTHGWQEGRASNGHFGCSCYHPLFPFNHFGDLERCLLRPGNAHSAEDWHQVLEPVVARYRDRGIALYFRADAAFAKPDIYERLEQEGKRRSNWPSSGVAAPASSGARA